MCSADSKCQTPPIWKKSVHFKWIFRHFYAFWEQNGNFQAHLHKKSGKFQILFLKPSLVLVTKLSNHQITEKSNKYKLTKINAFNFLKEMDPYITKIAAFPDLNLVWPNLETRKRIIILKILNDIKSDAFTYIFNQSKQEFMYLQYAIQLLKESFLKE